MKIAPSILTADFSILEKELKSISDADLIHVDIMDGNFVPNISFGPYISSIISKKTNLFLDFHLMVMDPLKWIDKFSFHNTNNITIHYESNDIDLALNKIRENNIKCGLSIKPNTKVLDIEKYLNFIDVVLVMSVEPGFGGQKFIENSIDKIKELVNIRNNINNKFIIQVDGGVNGENIEKLYNAGCDIVVIGSYLFNMLDRNTQIKKLKDKIGGIK